MSHPNWKRTVAIWLPIPRLVLAGLLMSLAARLVRAGHWCARASERVA